MPYMPPSAEEKNGSDEVQKNRQVRIRGRIPLRDNQKERKNEKEIPIKERNITAKRDQTQRGDTARINLTTIIHQERDRGGVLFNRRETKVILFCKGKGKKRPGPLRTNRGTSQFPHIVGTRESGRVKLERHTRKKTNKG